MPASSTDTLLLLPELFLTAAGLALLLYATVVKREEEGRIAVLSIASLAVTSVLVGVTVLLVKRLPHETFGGMFTIDRFGLYFKFLILFAAAVTILLSLRFVGTSPYPGGE